MTVRRLTASAVDSTAFHLLFFLHPLFFLLFFFLRLFFTSVLNGSSTVADYLTTVQRYYPNGHSRYSSGSFSFAYRPVYESLACCRNETDTESDSSHESADERKGSADGDSPSGNEDTGGNTDDATPDTNEEQDDASIEDTADEETDTR
jgi:hypothetical protein